MVKQVMFAAAWGLITEAGGTRYPLAQLPALLDKLQSLGYAGLEITAAHAMIFGLDRLGDELAKRGMRVILQVFSCGPPPTPAQTPGALADATPGVEHPVDDLESFTGPAAVARHKAVWAGQVREAARLAARGVLAKVNSHTGRDYFSAAEADELFSFCCDLADELKLDVVHETHRARILFSPWVLPRVLGAHPRLRLTADYSHFACVTECAHGPYAAPLNAAIAAAAPRVRHVHARVGFEEGPQVPDPREKTWAPYAAAHHAWWAAVAAAAAERGDAELTTLPEFGPPMYAWTIPYEGDRTVANVWDVNHATGIALTQTFAGVKGVEPATLKEDPDKGVWTL